VSRGDSTPVPKANPFDGKDNYRFTIGIVQNTGIGRLLQLGILLILVAAHLTSQAQNVLQWKDAAGNTSNLSDLQEILRKHREWVESAGKSGTKAYLRDLSGAHLMGADLMGADLNGANLSGAHLNGANLNGADLNGANLSGAHLNGAHLKGAQLGRAVFEPESLPELRGMAAAKNLELLTYQTNPSALVQLRKQFEDGGLREQEREITYALKRREAELSRDNCMRGLPTDCVSFVFNTVFFDWTCWYGMSPGRPLIFGCLLWLLCSLLYFGFIHTSGESGLYRVYGQSVPEDTETKTRVLRILPARIGQTLGPQRLFHFLWREWSLMRTAMFFSLMSAFNIGFRDINFGRWLRLLTRQEFDIKAVGWARVVAGWQSLISVYLLALWVLTYFGRPFG
jgi:hypothetical protein